MRAKKMRAILFATLLVAYSRGAVAQATGPTVPTGPAAPSITSTAALSHAVIVTISGGTPGATIHYTIDGSAPTAQSPQYFAPFLVASEVTVKAVAIDEGKPSTVATEKFTAAISTGTLVWTDDFNADSGDRPNPSIWTYDTGHTGFGNREFEHYCAWGDSTTPCDPAHPNVFVGPDGYLHIVARQPSPGTYTSARLKTDGLFTIVNAGPGVRIEARMKLPEGQGLWPAFWTLGSNIATDKWPACGEQDIMEHINAPTPDWIAGSLHGTHGDTTQHYPAPPDPKFSAGDWHIYGMIWSKGKIAFYVDTPDNIYTTVTPAAFTRPGAVWPFDSGNSIFLLLNLAVGGDWPGSPNATTKFPAETLVDYVRIYAN
ncbi:MAG TPA: FN3 associated domain-containing protein [Acidobacteriaceae bacterium]